MKTILLLLAASVTFVSPQQGGQAIGIVPIEVIYSRSGGLLQEITTTPFVVRRNGHVARFASDLELDGNDAYFVDPRAAHIERLAVDDDSRRND